MGGEIARVGFSSRSAWIASVAGPEGCFTRRRLAQRPEHGKHRGADRPMPCSAFAETLEGCTEASPGHELFYAEHFERQYPAAKRDSPVRGSVLSDRRGRSFGSCPLRARSVQAADHGDVAGAERGANPHPGPPDVELALGARRRVLLRSVRIFD